jgi:8-oxo-dGTP pyrophosphatase MutT (NUDIX family)
MSVDISTLPFRQGVNAIVVNDKKEFIMVFDKRGDYWKFPGGGLEEGENHEQAAIREVKEELGLDAEVVAVTEIKQEFMWPEALIEKNEFRYKGQQRSYVVLKLKSNEINLQEEEIAEFKWLNQESVMEYFKFDNMKEDFKNVVKKFPEYF